jgi:O-acetylhomoserine (thiol)-lyase
VKKTQGTRAVPIYQSTSYVFDNSEQAANLFALTEAGYIYTRLNNPTNDILEQRLAALEGGVAAVATASGTAAIATTLMTLLKSGDHIVASNSLYGGTYNMLSNTLPRFGITTTFVDPDEVKNFAKAVQPNTRAFFAESLGNPKLDVIDLKGISDNAKTAKVPFIVDNTIATPALLNPIKYGANIVIHSLTKYITGNGTTLGGIIIDAGTFDYSNGNYPEFTEPSPSYHGLKYHDALGPIAFIARVRVEGLRDLGSAPSPLNSFQVIQGLETLEVRMQRHSQNALELAKWLVSREEVSWVNYPGLNSSKYNELANKYLPNGKSGIVTFGLKKGFEAAKKVAESTKIFALLANIGDTKSLIIHPSSTTHSQLNEEEQSSTGVSSDLVRISVGIENIDDLKEDLDQALKAV